MDATARADAPRAGLRGSRARTRARGGDLTDRLARVGDRDQHAIGSRPRAGAPAPGRGPHDVRGDRRGDPGGGDPCNGERSLSLATEALRRAAEALRTVPGNREAGEPEVGDLTTSQERRLQIWAHQENVEDALAATAEVEDALGQLCTMARPFAGREAIVAAVHDGGRLIELRGRRGGTGRQLYATSQRMDVIGVMSEGAPVIVTGYDVDRKSGLVVEIVAAEGDPGPAAPVECVGLRFVPVQPMAPLFPGPYLLHLPSGYENGSTHLIERGMGFAAAATCVGGSDVASQRFWSSDWCWVRWSSRSSWRNCVRGTRRCTSRARSQAGRHSRCGPTGTTTASRSSARRPSCYSLYYRALGGGSRRQMGDRGLKH